MVGFKKIFKVYGVLESHLQLDNVTKTNNQPNKQKNPTVYPGNPEI